MSKEQNNAEIVTTCGQRLNALKQYVKATKATLTINGEPTKLADLIATYQACIDTRAAIISQRASLNKALDARDSAEVARQATDQGLKAWVITQFGANSQEAQNFGFLAPKVGAKSAATKATAVLKVRATREARGTRGKRQKALIKGTIVAPAAPAVPATTTPAALPAASVSASSNGALNGASPTNGATGSH